MITWRKTPLLEVWPYFVQHALNPGSTWHRIGGRRKMQSGSMLGRSLWTVTSRLIIWKWTQVKTCISRTDKLTLWKKRNMKIIFLYHLRTIRWATKPSWVMFLAYRLQTQRSHCSNHKAVNQANAIRKNVDVTGVGACACKHGFFVPHTVVDFKKGEQ